MKKIFLIASALISISTFSFGCQHEEEIGRRPSADLHGLDPDKAESYIQTQTRSSKRGMCSKFGAYSSEDLALYGSGVSWMYSWGPQLTNPDAASILKSRSIHYYPMAWNGKFDEAKLRAAKAADPSCEYLLAFNEPNHLGQAEMTPQQAAEAWPRLKALAAELGMKLISPALNYGSMPGYNDPVTWYDEFFAQPGVSLDDVYGIAIHCYMPAASSMASFVTHFYKYGKPIWMTEFCAADGGNISRYRQLEYVSDAVNYLEGDPHVFAYAWFMDRSDGSSTLTPYFDITTKQTPNVLSDVGTVYVNISTLDKQTYYQEGEIIPASSYSNQAAAESAAQSIYKDGIKVRPTTDSKGVLEIFNFKGANWVEYQIDVPSDGVYRFDVRYAAELKMMFDITHGDEKSTLVVDSTIGYNVWKSSCVLLTLKAGKQTIRLSPRVNESDVVFNWFRFVKIK